MFGWMLCWCSFQGLFLFLTCSTSCRRPRLRTLSSGCSVTGSRLSPDSSPASQVNASTSQLTGTMGRKQEVLSASGREQEEKVWGVLLWFQAGISWGWAARISSRSAALQTGSGSLTPWREGETFTYTATIKAQSVRHRKMIFFCMLQGRRSGF